MNKPDSHLLGMWKRLVFGRGHFSSARDFLKYLVLCAQRSRGDRFPVNLGIRALGNRRVICRRGTTDVGVLWATFHEQFHLPDQPLRPDCCILDLGSNVGYTVAHFAAVYPGGRVFGVEMDQENHAVALQNIKPLGNRCTILHAAVGASDGRVAYGGQREDALRVLHGESPSPANAKWVRSLSMNTLIKDLGLDRIDFLKMDIEGAEFDLFRGATEWLKLVSAMKIEYHPPEDVVAIEKVLRDYGFACTPDRHHWSALTASRPRP